MILIFIIVVIQAVENSRDTVLLVMILVMIYIVSIDGSIGRDDIEALLMMTFDDHYQYISGSIISDDWWYGLFDDYY